MKYEAFKKEFEPLGNKAESDGDVYFVSFFSREEDGYNAFWLDKLDAGDALLIIDGLIKKFDLSAENIADNLRALAGDDDDDDWNVDAADYYDAVRPRDS